MTLPPKLAEQLVLVGLQFTPEGDETTAPLPITSTETGFEPVAAKLALTEVAALTVTVQLLEEPEQAPLQLSKR